MLSNYDSDDALRQSPGLQPSQPKLTPSPSPPPFVPQWRLPLHDSDKPLRLRKRCRAKRKTRPSQSDRILVQYLGPDHTDVSWLAGEEPLNSASQSEISDLDTDNESDKEVAARSKRFRVGKTAPNKEGSSNTSTSQTGAHTTPASDGVGMKPKGPGPLDESEQRTQ